MSKSQSLTLSEVEAQFVDWRRTRTRPQTPDELKTQALALLADHSIREVCRALRLNYETLKRWGQEQATATPPATSFVSVPPVAGSAPAAALTPLTLTRHGSDGSTLSISGELPPAQWAWALELLQERS